MTHDEIIRPQIIKVRDCYGEIHRIDALQLYLTERVQLSRYTSGGRKLSEHFAAMNWGGRSTTIHRENIVEVL